MLALHDGLGLKYFLNARLALAPELDEIWADGQTPSNTSALFVSLKKLNGVVDEIARIQHGDEESARKLTQLP